MTSSLPLCDRMCRRPSPDFPDRKTHQPSGYDDRRFRLAFRPDRIVAGVHRPCQQYLCLSSHLPPIFCFDKPNRLAPKEIRVCRHRLSRERVAALGCIARIGPPVAAVDGSRVRAKGGAWRA